MIAENRKNFLSFLLHRLEQPEAVPWTDGPALLMSGIITGAGGGAVVLVKRIPSPSIIAYSESIW